MASTIVLNGIRFLWAAQYFLLEIGRSNQRFLSFSASDGKGWLSYLLATYTVVFLSNYLLSKKKLTYFTFIFVEFLNLPLIFFPLFVPSKAFSFFMGVQNCSYAMSIHAIAFERYFMDESPKSSKIASESANFWTNLRTILAFGIPKRLSPLGNGRLPSAAMIFHGFVITTIGDACTFITREWMPFHIQPANMRWALSLVGALWQMCALEFAYWNIAVIADLFAAPLTPDMHHKNPLLSTSLAEFWGLRWNPVISKQLQDSIYKPLRKVGAHKSISVVACFTGSALIHAIPKLISEGSLEEFLMMFGFFFSQGFCLILEVIMQKLAYKLLNAKKSDTAGTKNAKLSNVSSDQQTPIKANGKGHAKTESVTPRDPEEVIQSYNSYMQTTRDNFFIELAIMVMLISGFYLIFEDRFQSKPLIVLVIVLIVFILHRVVVIQSELFDKSNKGNRSVQFSKSVMIMLIVLGWAWTVSCFVAQLPLYVIPMMSVISEFYSQSLVVGSFIRTLEAVHFVFISS